MSHLIFNRRGIGLIEVVIAIFMVTVGVLAILSMQPSAWKAVGKSDYLGRGAGLVHRELAARETWIMNPCNIIPPNGDRPMQTITVSGLGGSVNGDATYTVNTNITRLGATNAWTVTTTVTWANQQAYGYRNLSESLLVSRQEMFRFPDSPNSCTDDTNAVPAGW
jgi:hypothetical protein